MANSHGAGRGLFHEPPPPETRLSRSVLRSALEGNVSLFYFAIKGTKVKPHHICQLEEHLHFLFFFRKAGPQSVIPADAT